MTVWKILMIVSVTLAPAFPQRPESTGPKSIDQAEQTSSQASQGEQHRSALEVKPGEEAIKNKDLFEASGYFHPFRRMPRFVIADQKKIWTSPFHTSKSDAKYWAIFGGATGALIAFDEQIQKNAPNPGWLVTLGTRGSYLGAAYTLIPISAGFYFLGSKARNERFREAGLMSFESLINSTIVEEVLKVTTDRERPLEGTGEGRFFHSPNRINAGFPSGHTINTFALASILRTSTTINSGARFWSTHTLAPWVARGWPPTSISPATPSQVPLCAGSSAITSTASGTTPSWITSRRLLKESSTMCTWASALCRRLLVRDAAQARTLH